MTWHDMTLNDTTRRDATRRDATLRDAMRGDAMRCDATRHDTTRLTPAEVLHWPRHLEVEQRDRRLPAPLLGAPQMRDGQTAVGL